MTISISGELEPILKAEAGKAGLDLTAYTHRLLWASLPGPKPSTPSVSAEESLLLNRINHGLAAEALDRYHELIGKRQEEIISSEEFRQLDDLTRQMEAQQTSRLENLVKLAELRRIPLAHLMARLEIPPPNVL